MPATQSSTQPQPFAKRIAGYGCTDFIRLDGKLSTPAQIDYLDLLPANANQPPALTAVAEHQGSALLYLVDACGDAKSDTSAIAMLSRQLANRSDPAWLGVARAGSLDIFPIGFREPTDAQPIVTVEARSSAAPLFFQSLVHGTLNGNQRLHGNDYVYQKIFKLLTRTTDEFVPPDGPGQIDALDVLSMAGRALFFRFLIDRRIVFERELSGDESICPAADDLKDAFSTAERAAQTSAWLDATFNGDFLPLIDESIPLADRSAREDAYLRFYKRIERLVGKNIFNHLCAILRGWQAVGGDIQTEIDWGDLDFAYIPVGVLSQVYESFSHRADPSAASETSVHYTPRTIAKLMVDEAFSALKNPAGAIVLDSSCGAGIFLVLAFRRLFRERWQAHEQPTTRGIQEILYHQLRGFDISESALRLAALALYITAIELNASPRPPRALRFPRNLRGTVLHRVGENVDTKRSAFPLGSLGEEVPPEFDSTFDIVIGNPPWKRLRDKPSEDAARGNDDRSETGALNAEFTAIGRRVLAARGFSDLAMTYQNPDKNPDLPFLWRAMEWAKPGGIIALAMPARVLSHTTGKGLTAWHAILEATEVTGIINGANLRFTRVWEGVKVPFCILFARNKTPRGDYRLNYAAPTFEPPMNGVGRFRIDYEGAHSVSVADIKAQAWLLKALSVGTWLDVEIVRTLLGAAPKTLHERWAEWDPSHVQTGLGFNRSPDSDQTVVDFLAELPVFEPPDHGFVIEYEKLQTYGLRFGANVEGKSSAHMPRRRELYQPPLVILAQAPGAKRSLPTAYLADRPLAFSQSYYGYSCRGYPAAQSLASLIFLVAHSTLFRYFALMVSGSQGADRMRFTKGDVDAFPFPDVTTFSQAQAETLAGLAERLQSGKGKPWREIDTFIFALYGLDEDAVQAVEDTLFSAAAYRKAGKTALECTTRETRAPFVDTLRNALEPYFDVCGSHVSVREVEVEQGASEEPWFFLAISTDGLSFDVGPKLLRSAMEAANRRGCSRIIVQAPKKSGIVLGLLNQCRWWTATRARLCAQHIIRERLAAFRLPEAP